MKSLDDVLGKWGERYENSQPFVTPPKKTSSPLRIGLCVGCKEENHDKHEDAKVSNPILICKRCVKPTRHGWDHHAFGHEFFKCGTCSEERSFG